MIEGRSSDRAAARTQAYADPERIDGLLDILIEATARYLAMQARAGAQVLKLFESWAEGLSEPLFERLVIRPHAAVIARLRELGVQTPVIGFPRGAGTLVQAYADQVDSQAVALDVQASAAFGRAIQASKPIQGALDPLLLRAGGPELDRRVEELLVQWGAGPYVFNLGHGILPDTPIEHVARTVERVVNWKGAA
jgi:uroporphyrinogen decarboxylase